MNNQYLIRPPLLIRLMVDELHLFRTVNIFRSLEPITYLRKEQDTKKSYFSNSPAPNGRRNIFALYARMGFQVKKVEQRKYIGCGHSHNQIRFYKTSFLETG